MRQELFDPIADKRRLQAVEKVVRELYCLHAGGEDYSEALLGLCDLVGHAVSKSELRGAFGSICEETFAQNLLIDRAAIPANLSEAEMLELIERIRVADGSEFQIGYWIDCLEVNTKDEWISDLLFCPGNYFEDGNNTREMSARQILEIALAAGRGDFRAPVSVPNLERAEHWESFKRCHPPGTSVTGSALRVEPYGIHVDLGVPFDALLHVRFMVPVGRRKRFPADFPKIGDIVTAIVRNYGDPRVPGKGGMIVLTQNPQELSVISL